MGDSGRTGGRRARWLRWLGRGTGSLVAGFWLFIAVVGAVGGAEPWTLESSILTGLIVCSVAGVAVAWWREGLGGTLLLVIAAAYGLFAYFAAGHNKGMAVAVSGGPFLVVGLLFLASWWGRRKDGQGE